MFTDYSFDELFPRDRVVELFRQTYSWTSIESVRRAAQVLEGSADESNRWIILVTPTNDLLKTLLIKSFSYMIDAFHCGAGKLAIAKRLDPPLSQVTWKQLEDSEFRPTVEVGKMVDVKKKFPNVPGDDNATGYILEDEPHVIELVFEPLQMLRDTLVTLWSQASECKKIESEYKHGRDSDSKFVHVHRSDSDWAATLDALVYYSFKFRVGIQWSESSMATDLGYRCVNLIGRPPFEPRLVKVAKESFKNMAKELSE